MLQDKFNNDFNNLLYGIKPNNLAIAVSGGVDSIALLHLVSSWALSFKIKITVLMVNHNLRDEVKSEIEYVKHITENKLGHKFFLLSWDSGNKKSALQERAREARYNLMTKKCHDLSIRTLLTAHHFDDMVETYLMRKNKTNSILGLSSSNSFFHNDIHILRPLCNFTKLELIQYLERQKIHWCEDHTNKSDIYERNRIRKDIAKLTSCQKRLIHQEIIDVNKRAANLNQELIIAIAESLKITNYGFAVIDLINLRKYGLEVKIHLLNYIFTVISGKNTIPRFRNIKNLLEIIASNNDVKCSLHGCILNKQRMKLSIFREYASIDKTSFDLKLFQYWDNRFTIHLNNIPENHQITLLSFEDYILIKDKINLDYLAKITNDNHKSILFTLPVIKNIEKIVAIPHISYYDKFDREIIKKVIFKPKFVSRFTHFL